MYGRLAALPDQAEPLQRSQLLAALSVGTEIIQLRRIARRLGSGADARCGARSLGARRQRYRDRPASPGSTKRSPLPDPAATRFSAGARQHPCNRRRRSPSMPPTSTQERPGEVRRDRPVRRLCRADLVDDGRRLDRHDRVAPVRRPFRPVALCLAPGAVCVRGLHDRAVVDGPCSPHAEFAMSDVETKSRARSGAGGPRGPSLAEPPARDTRPPAPADFSAC